MRRQMLGHCRERDISVRHQPDPIMIVARKRFGDLAPLIPPELPRVCPPIPISRVIQRMSANVDDARLGRRLGWRFRLCRKLKHHCLLTLMQVRQENKRAIRKFECVVMHLWYVLIDLSKDRRSGAYCSPAKETERRTYHLGGKGELRSGKNADRRCGILRRGKPTCTGAEVVGRKLVTDLCRA